MDLYLLSAGAAKGLVDRLQGQLQTEHGIMLNSVFDAVGAIRERFVAGVRCDVVILTAAQIAELDRSGLLTRSSATPIGAVHTAVAVPAGRDAPDVSDSARLRSCLRAATALYVPDMRASTAGRHVKAVLEQLGVAEEMERKLRTYPNGETAMRHLAADAGGGALGCTQLSEIRNTAGLMSAGNLPEPHALATIYSAAVGARAADPAKAARLVSLLTGAETRALRQQCGFDPIVAS